MKKPTKKQKAYAEARVKGLSRTESAILAGSDPDNITRTENTKGVQQALADIRQELRTNSGITKEDVLQMFQSAVDMAKLSGDTTGLVAAAREIGKMLGFYAPEVKKTLLGVDQASLKRALQDMGEDELLRIANARTIEGESLRIEDKS